jgi:hypothetical protein
VAAQVVASRVVLSSTELNCGERVRHKTSALSVKTMKLVVVRDTTGGGGGRIYHPF